MQVLDRTKIWFMKPHVKMGIFVFLITLLIFGLGYIIGRDWTPAPIVIENNTSD